MNIINIILFLKIMVSMLLKLLIFFITKLYIFIHILLTYLFLLHIGTDIKTSLNMHHLEITLNLEI